jgi:NitT/TauT family transport system substrate-binding protein
MSQQRRVGDRPDREILGVRGPLRRLTSQRAALKGPSYSLDNPDEAATILNKAEPTAAIPAAVGEIKAMKQYSTPVGKLDQQRVAAGIAELVSTGLMPAGLTPAQVADFSLA